ncbi:globin [Ornithinimicrobium sp. Arc0846-15]|nr:globin [Ornithinimicrobium laminariae]
MSEQTPETPQTYYERVGGHETFAKLVREFYRGVAGDPPLRAMYPEADLAPAEHRFLMFLEQYWGGPKTYSEQRGHPRLRMRHGPFVVTPKQRDRWMFHMSNAIESIELDPMDEELMRSYMTNAANFMINSPDLS